MTSRYVEITYDQMAHLLEEEMGFHQIYHQRCGEFVWSRKVETKSGQSFPYAVTVYSSVDRTTRTTRNCGDDAIRVVLVDLETGKAMKLRSEKGKAGQRIYRTKNALSNLKERCREYFHQVIYNRCPLCGSVMVERTKRATGEKFYGCSHYPTCRGSKNA